MRLPKPTRMHGVSGRPPRHGPEFRFTKPETWPEPAITTITDTTNYGKAETQAWDRVHPRLAHRSSWLDHDGELPLVEGTLIRLRVERLSKDRDAPSVWLWSSKTGATPDDVDRFWQAFLRRFDLEHTCDRTVLDRLIQVLRFGCSYEAIADTTCSASTIRNRRDDWIKAGLFAALKRIALDAYDRIVGLILDQIAVDGCITKAPGGGQCAGPSPVDRRKQGMKRSLMVEGHGIPLGRVLAGTNRHDSPLLAPPGQTR